MELTNPTGTTVFDVANGDKFTASGPAVLIDAADGRNFAIWGDPAKLGFNYQTFGAWGDDDRGEGIISVGSFGNSTSVPTVPQPGTATYNGASLGVVEVAGVTGFTSSDVKIETNFSDVSFETTNTTFADGAGPIPAGDLNLTGTGSVAGDGLRITGDLSAVSNPEPTINLDGRFRGRFFGPNAEEVGGTFFANDIEGENDVKYLGAFGAKR